jgi:hypothetical protein
MHVAFRKIGMGIFPVSLAIFRREPIVTHRQGNRRCSIIHTIRKSLNVPYLG